jgi:hypothetical protein
VHLFNSPAEIDRALDALHAPGPGAAMRPGVPD